MDEETLKLTILAKNEIVLDQRKIIKKLKGECESLQMENDVLKDEIKMFKDVVEVQRFRDEEGGI